MAEYTKDGHMIPDPTPLEIPVGFHQPEDIMQVIQRLVRLESNRASGVGEETFEESDDFDMEESQDQSGYQVMTDERVDLGKFVTNQSVDPDTEKEFREFRAWKEKQRQESDALKNSTSDVSKSV